MKFTKEKKERITYYLLRKISDNSETFIKNTSQAFSISQTTVYRYLMELCDNNIIEKCKNGRYKLINTETKKLYYLNDDLEEDIVYKETLEILVKDFSNNIKKIWQYSFSEMFNNAIDHSEAKSIYVHIKQNYLFTEVVILDDGVGIFKKICNYFGFEKIDDAITELFKGKLTTDPDRHSGEGIFFTSRVMDRFLLWSDNKMFTHDNDCDRLFNMHERESLDKDEGTYLVMCLSNYSKKEIVDVFDRYSSIEGGFTVTNIPLRNIFDNAYPVSRSQAKRLYNRLDDFEEVILDFDGIESIGQGFAHELFVVFNHEHPNIKFEIINGNEEVMKMIRHVRYETIKL